MAPFPSPAAPRGDNAFPVSRLSAYAVGLVLALYLLLAFAAA